MRQINNCRLWVRRRGEYGRWYTGLRGDDRIVSFGAAEIRGDTPTGRVIHLVFDPGRNSHPMARRMHGCSDWVLQLQPFFSEHAAELFQVLSSADLIVGHNVEFDLAFLGRELRKQFGLEGSVMGEQDIELGFG